MNNTLVKRNTLFILNKLVFMIIFMCSVIMIGTIQSYAEEPSDMQIPEDAQYWCGHWYKVYDEALTPAEAKAKCESMGGYLATATTAKEYNQIWGMIESKSTAKKAYTIMDIHKAEEGWDWDTGEELCYTKWQSFGNVYKGDIYFFYNAGLCLGWSDEALIEAKELGQWNQYGSTSQIPKGTTKTNHHIAILNGHLSFSMYATCSSYYIPGEGDAYHSLSGKGGMVEFNEDDVKNGYICEWGSPITLTSDNVLLNNQTAGNKTPVKYVFDGNTKKPSTIKVYNEGIELTLNQDYVTEIQGRSIVGAAKVIVTGINRYQGSVIEYYYVIPAKVSKPTLTLDNETHGIIIKWNAVEQAQEYDVRWATSTDGLETAKIYEFDDGREFPTGELDRGENYYVQVRAVGDRKNPEVVGAWSDTAKIYLEDIEVWFTIFSDKRSTGHAFLNVENLSSEDVIIGPYILKAGKNMYVAGRGVKHELLKEIQIKNTKGGCMINWEGQCSQYETYKDFAWYTTQIKSSKLKILYECMKSYGTYNFLTNNCAEFASKTWNAIVDDTKKVTNTNLPDVLYSSIVNDLKGKTESELKVNDTVVTDIFILDSAGDLLPFSINTDAYVSAVNTLRVTDKTAKTVTLEWDTLKESIGIGQYNITKIVVEYGEANKKTTSVELSPDATSLKLSGLNPGTEYSFHIYGVSDHQATGAGIVTGRVNTNNCKAKTDAGSSDFSGNGGVGDNVSGIGNKESSVTKITTAGTSHNIAVGKKIKLTATVLPKNASNTKLKWTSSNKEIATVTQTGWVKINKSAAGKTVKITATATDGSGKKSVWKIKVMKGAVKKILVKGYRKTLKAGKTMKLTAKVKASKGANKKLKWTSSNKKWATVTQSGKVKALMTGKGKTVKIKVMSTDGTNKKKVLKIRIK